VSLPERAVNRPVAIACLISLLLASGTPVFAATAPAQSAISQEPFFAGLVTEAGRLKAETEAFRPATTLVSQPGFPAYAQAIRALSANDQKGHLTLKARGTDNDLKCILTGLSRDLPVKLDAIQTAKTDADMKAALIKMAALLSDNIDVIVTPATADSGLDCTLEFGPGA
jgi:hypothetical protein